MPYPEAELEAVRLSTTEERPELVLVYRIMNGPQQGQRIRLVTSVADVHYIDIPEEPLEDHGNRSREETARQETEEAQHCECFYCEDCPHEETFYCEACQEEGDPDEEFWEA